MPESTHQPFLNERTSAALRLVQTLHRDHARKGTEVPYISHLFAVASLVLEDGGDEDETIAALLHDALEDQGHRITAADIEEQFGPRVRELVEGCTDTPPDHAGGQRPDWKTRRTEYFADIRSGRAPLRLSLADKLHNARCILRDMRQQGDSLWDRFSASREDQLWYYRSLVEAYRDAGATGYLIDEFDRVVRRIEKEARG